MQYNRVWYLTREMIDYHIAHCADAGYEVPEAIASWPAHGNTADGYSQMLAPFYDADSNGIYWPAAGDYPVIRGDECVFSIFNDNFMSHYETRGEPLGIEVHCMVYAFDEPQDTALNNTVFVHYDVYNRTANAYADTYIGAWSDFDIGYAYNDYIGCDVRRGMFYGYNGMDNDSQYETGFTSVSPAQGCVILGGPAIPADGRDNSKVDIEKILSDGYTNSTVK